MEEKGRKAIKIRPKSIVKYWSDKYVTEDGEIINDIYDSECEEIEDAIAIIPSTTEPRCMACGTYFSVIENHPKYKKYAGLGEYWKLWENHRVRNLYEIIHIIPEPYSGDYGDSGNVVILCHDCADEYREKKLREKKKFFEWLYAERILGDDIQVNETCERLEIWSEDFADDGYDCFEDMVRKEWDGFLPYKSIKKLEATILKIEKTKFKHVMLDYATGQIITPGE